MKIVTRSLILVVALSLLDLVWTLLASQAGTMRELNPVGGRLIDDPAKLIAFKVAMTGLAAGLIFKLRYYRRAQLASWWACLILTFVDRSVADVQFDARMNAAISFCIRKAR